MKLFTKIFLFLFKNMYKIITAHNAKILNANSSNPGCNCSISEYCPLNGGCLTDNVVYKASIETLVV